MKMPQKQSKKQVKKMAVLKKTPAVQSKTALVSLIKLRRTNNVWQRKEAKELNPFTLNPRDRTMRKLRRAKFLLLVLQERMALCLI